MGPASAIPAQRAAHSLPPSLWAATAPPGPPTPALHESTTADVLVIGAGYTGLSTALHLSERGADVCVLDAHEPGWGASGRNGGQVNPSLKHDPHELIRLLGAPAAEALIREVSSSADLVFDLIAKHKIDCDPVRKGWLQLSYSSKELPALYARADQWEARGVQVERLDRSSVAQRVGTQAFAGGWWDGRAGAIQPLAYARGLASAAQRHGARIHGHTAVQTIERQGGYWVATTAHGMTVRAERIVIATNGYTDSLWPGLASTVLAANSFIVATQPLSHAQSAHILAGSETVATSQRLLLYFRKDAQNRLLMGGRGFFADPTGPSDFAHLEKSLALLFPELSPLTYEFRWAGRVAITRDFMPHVHEPAPGITAALGCNGRGIALCSSMGRQIADKLLSAQADFAYPLTSIQPIPLHGLQRFYIGAGVAWYSLLDKIGWS